MGYDSQQYYIENVQQIYVEVELCLLVQTCAVWLKEEFLEAISDIKLKITCYEVIVYPF